MDDGLSLKAPRRAGSAPGLRVLQPIGEILLQIRCRCDDERSAMQFLIASGGKHGAGSMGIDWADRPSYAVPGAKPEPILAARHGPQRLPARFPSACAIEVERIDGGFKLMHSPALDRVGLGII